MGTDLINHNCWHNRGKGCCSEGPDLKKWTHKNITSSKVLHLGWSNPRCEYRLGEGVMDIDMYCLRMNFSGNQVNSLLHVLKVLSKYESSVAGHQR